MTSAAQHMDWRGVLPAITTPFREDGSIDHDFLREHCSWLVDRGMAGVVACGSLGEGATLSVEEKGSLLESCVTALGDRAPVIAGIAATSTGDAQRLASRARDVGCRGLMVLPPYVHQGAWREIEAHFAAVLTSTDLPCMLYNNPIAYGTDILPEQVEQLARVHDNVGAVKESSGDIRRMTALRARLGDRVAVLVGIDDLLVEGVAAGAVGWVAGLANALPEESAALFEGARDAGADAVAELYHWFLPLLRLDTEPELVQLIKMVQQEVGMGNEIVRAPRLQLAGVPRERALVTIREALAARPALP